MLHLSIIGMTVAALFQAPFVLEDDGQAITVLEGDQAVLVYRYQPGDRPVYASERYARACYIHPLYGLDGEILTQDFPLDHFHHRGVFWAWPDSTLGDRRVDVWALDGARQVHKEWLTREADAARAEIAVVNHWILDDAPADPIIREKIRFLIHPAAPDHRAIDFELTFTNIAEEVFTLRGSDTEGKGYGGLCLRPDAMRKPLTFLSEKGVSEEDVLELDSPWVDVSYATETGGDTLSGAAIFQHPDFPGYPHPGWILRHYGFLGQSWPHSKEHVMQPGEKFTLRYRLFIHRGDGISADVAGAFARYTREMKGEKE